MVLGRRRNCVLAILCYAMILLLAKLVKVNNNYCAEKVLHALLVFLLLRLLLHSLRYQISMATREWSA